MGSEFSSSGDSRQRTQHAKGVAAVVRGLPSAPIDAAPAPIPAPAGPPALAAAPAAHLGNNPLGPFERRDRGRHLPRPLPPAPAPDLTRFDAADAANIARLLLAITPRMHGITGCEWLPEEELLELLYDVYRLRSSPHFRGEFPATPSLPVIRFRIAVCGQFALMCLLWLVACKNFYPIAHPTATVPASAI
jgi:hypothetical protein